MIIKVTGSIIGFNQSFKVNLDVEVPENQTYQGKGLTLPLRALLDKGKGGEKSKTTS